MGLKAALNNSQLTGKLLNLANQHRELDRIGRSIDGLMQNASFSSTDAKQAVCNLLDERHFYGTYCELGAYDWLEQNQAAHIAQVALNSTDVLNPNGCMIDGQFKNYDAYFDIKGFGVQAYLMDIFIQRLQSFTTGLTISIDGPLDVAVKDIEKYAFGSIKQFISKLSKGTTHHIKELHWSIKVDAPTSVSATVHSNDPFVFAEQNRYYPFKTSRQFTLNTPFLLIFPYSSQFNSTLASNVFNMTDIAIRALARRVFIQLAADKTPLAQHDNKTDPGLTVADAAELISALLFINLDNDEALLFSNPRARNVLTKYHIEQIFDFAIPVEMGIDDFEHDNY